MVAFGDRKDFLQLLRMVHFLRKCTMRNNCKRDAEEAEPLPARGNAPCATTAKGMRKRQSLCRLEEMHHAQQLQKGCGRGRASTDSRKCTMRNNCKRDAEEAEPLPTRGNAPCATTAKGMRKRQSLYRLEEMHHAQQLQKGCGRG